MGNPRLKTGPSRGERSECGIVRIVTFAGIALLGIATTAPTVVAQGWVDPKKDWNQYSAWCSAHGGRANRSTTECVGGNYGAGPSSGSSNYYNNMTNAYNLGLSIGNAMNQAMAAIERQAHLARIQEALNLNQKGIEAYNREDYDSAAAAFEQAIRLSPNDPNMRSNLVEANNRLAEQRAQIAQQMAEASARVGTMLGDLQSQFANERSTLNEGLSDTAFLQPSGTSFFGLGGGPGTPPSSSDAGELGFVKPNYPLFSKGTQYSAPVDLRDTANDQLAAAGPIGTNASTSPVESGGGLQFVAPDARVPPSAPPKPANTPTATIAPLLKPKPVPSKASKAVVPPTTPASSELLPPVDVRRLTNGSAPAPSGAERTCQDVAADLAKLWDLTRRAVLAEDVYKRYAPNNSKPNQDMPGFIRISDDVNEIRRLIPGINEQSIKQLLYPEGSDYRAAIYQDKKDPRKIFLAFRGTVTAGDFTDANIPQGTGMPSEYYDKAIALAKTLKKSAEAEGMELEIVGHSLGGGMAGAAGAANRVRTTSFNPAGVHPNTLIGLDVADAEKYVTNYVVDADPLNSAQDHRQGIAPIVAIGSTLTVPGAGAFVGAWAITEVAMNGALPQAIGQRETLDARPQDTNSLDPFKPHYMATVRSIFADRFNNVSRERTTKGCAE